MTTTSNLSNISSSAALAELPVRLLLPALSIITDICWAVTCNGLSNLAGSYICFNGPIPASNGAGWATAAGPVGSFVNALSYASHSRSWLVLTLLSSSCFIRRFTHDGAQTAEWEERFQANYCTGL